MEQNQKSEDRFDVYNYIGIHTRDQSIISQYITGNDVLRFHFHVDQSGDTAVITMPVLKGFSYDTGKVDPCDVNLISLYAALGDFCKKKRAELKEGEWLFEIPDEPVQQTDNFIHDFEETMPVEFLIRASSDEYMDTSETYSALTKLYDVDCYLEGPQRWQKNDILPIINIDEDTRIVFEYAHGPWTIPFYNLWEKAAVFAGIREAQEKTKLIGSDIPGPIKVEVLDLDKVTKEGYLFTTEEVQRAVDAFDERIRSPGDTSYFGRHLTKPFESIDDIANVSPDNVTHSVIAMSIEDGKLWVSIEFWPQLKSRKVYELYEKKLGAFRIIYGGGARKTEDAISITDMRIISVDFVDVSLLEYAALL